MKTPTIELKGAAGAHLPSLGQVLRDPFAFWPQELLHTGAVLAQAGKRRIAFIADPDAVSTILLNRNGAYPRSRFHDRILGQAYGENLIQVEKEDWQNQRREMAQPITSERANSLVPRLKLAAGEMLDEWSQRPEGQPIDLLADARRLTLDALHRALFASEAEALTRDECVDRTARRIAEHAPVDLKQELSYLRVLAERLARQPQSRPQERARGGRTGSTPDDLNTLTLFLHAGHDNASAALCWMLWLVAQRPDLQQSLREEWQAAEAEKFSLARLPLADAAVSETLRLYPPIAQLVREVPSGLAIGEHFVLPGTTAIIAIYALHRHRTLWERPDEFLPERFLGGRQAASRRAGLVPFGSGPRGCIGSSLARVELTLFLAMICARFELRANPESPLRCRTEWGLRPGGEAPIFLTRHD